MNEQIERKCPECGSLRYETTKNTKLQQFARLWFVFILLAIPAAKYLPLLIIPTLFVGGFLFIINQKRTNGNKIAESLTCLHCGHNYFIPTKRGLELAEKEIKKETELKEKKLALQKEKARKDYENSTNGFGKLNEDEKLWKEFDNVSRRKSIYGVSRGKLKVTDQAILWYSTRNCQRIAWDDISAISAKKFFKIAPTGIDITTPNGIVELVVPKKERNAVLYYLQNAFERRNK